MKESCAAMLLLVLLHQRHGRATQRHGSKVCGKWVENRLGKYEVENRLHSDEKVLGVRNTKPGKTKPKPE